ncbi:hypothetical protein QTI66_32100 [Variovorax sp. J22R133]|uniref:hypothetical protein n=1 Tax=Variovorax brevis TaxID=3053503 RepID=UPI002578033E|nr:hypothetical protein [Variovorax sp. J22R133]MDM0116780.1 hypothetical protein [Variovorax sp. J22R133]
MVDAIATVLGMRGLEVQGFIGQGELAEAVSKTRFDAYVLDWLLGDATALDVVIQLRGDPANHNTPIFLLSGNLALSGVPIDPVLAQTITAHRLFYRAKPYSMRLLARDILIAHEGGTP